VIPGSQLEIFEQSEHFPHMDEPARFARVLLHFLATTEPMRLDRTMIRERMAQRVREHEEAEVQAAAAAALEAERPAPPGDEPDGAVPVTEVARGQVDPASE
jgi:hypothetical protein